MWVTDGSSELTSQGNKVECRVGSCSGNVYNAIWKTSDSGSGSESKTYWKLKCEEIPEGNIFAGFTDTDKFQKGWACKGLFYGGNLSEGGRLLLSSFGPCLKTGDTLGMFIQVDETNLKVYFDVNGSSLGLAFDLPKTTLSSFIPAVHFSESGVVTIEQSTEFPSTTREEAVCEGMEGNWEYSDGSLNTFGERVQLDIKSQSSDAFRASLRVINRISVIISRESASGPWTGRTGTTTLMGASNELMNLERQITQLMYGTFTLENDKLKISDNSNNSTWSRFKIVKNPITTNPFV